MDSPSLQAHGHCKKCRKQHIFLIILGMRNSSLWFRTMGRKTIWKLNSDLQTGKSQQKSNRIKGKKNETIIILMNRNRHPQTEQTLKSISFNLRIMGKVAAWSWKDLLTPTPRRTGAVCSRCTKYTTAGSLCSLQREESRASYSKH